MAIKDSTLTVKPQDTLPEPESYSIYGWPTKLREEYLDKWRKENPSPVPLDFRVDEEDRKSTRLNSSHGYISYAVFCLKKKKNKQHDWLLAGYNVLLFQTVLVPQTFGHYLAESVEERR